VGTSSETTAQRQQLSRLTIPRRHVIVVALVGVLVLVGAAFLRAPTYDSGVATYTTSSGHVYRSLLPDSVAYLQMADRQHGGPGSDMRPFTSRLLAPELAGWLPTDAGVGLRTVNLGLLCLGLVALTALIGSWVRRTTSLVIAVLLYATAIPVVKFGWSLMVDGAVVGAIAVGIWVIQRRPLWNGLVAIVLAVLVKEWALVLVPFAIATDLTTCPRPRRTSARIGAWCAAGMLGLALSWLGGRSGRTVFVPWIPHDLQTVKFTLQNNLGRPDGWMLAAATLFVPVLSTVILGVAAHRRWVRIEPVRFIPFAIGGTAGAAVWASAAAIAWWDIRSAWLVVPFGVPMAALLIDAVLERGVRSVLLGRRGRQLAMTLGAIGVVALVVMSAVESSFSISPFFAHGLEPRLGREPTEPRMSSVDRHGSGRSTIAIPDFGAAGPVVLDVTVATPSHVRIDVSGSPSAVFDGRLEDRGTFLLDSQDRSPRVRLDVDGGWSGRFRTLDTLGVWNASAALTGHGPNVLLIPGGSTESYEASFGGSRTNHIWLVGNCHIPRCPDNTANVLPIGLEALVVDDPGDWFVTPHRVQTLGQQVTLDDLKKARTNTATH
jgi:hypothetical protein